MNTAIVNEPYDRDGTPGRACTACNSAWPASEPDDAPWHHARGCTAGQRCPGCGAPVTVEGVCSRCEA